MIRVPAAFVISEPETKGRFFFAGFSASAPSTAGAVAVGAFAISGLTGFGLDVAQPLAIDIITAIIAIFVRLFILLLLPRKWGFISLAGNSLP